MNFKYILAISKFGNYVFHNNHKATIGSQSILSNNE